MQTSIEIIEEIKNDASRLQRKFLTLPGKSEGPRNPLMPISNQLHKLIDNAQSGLLNWRSWELEELKKAFSEES